MNFKIISILVCLVFVFGCSQQVKTTEGDPKIMTQDISDPDAFCLGQGSMKDSCYSAVAFYNNDISLCDKITGDEMEEKRRESCKKSLETGKFMFREYATGVGCSYDGKEFIEKCKQECNKKGMAFLSRQTLEDATSIDGYFECKSGKMKDLSACYCFPK